MERKIICCHFSISFKNSYVFILIYLDITIYKYLIFNKIMIFVILSHYCEVSITNYVDIYIIYNTLILNI